MKNKVLYKLLSSSRSTGDLKNSTVCTESEVDLLRAAENTNRALHEIMLGTQQRNLPKRRRQISRESVFFRTREHPDIIYESKKYEKNI